MIVSIDRNYLNGTISVDVVGDWVHCLSIESLVAQTTLTVTAPGDGSSVIRVEGTNDPTHADVTQMTSFAGDGGGSLSSIISTLQLGLEKLPEWIRLAWRHGATDPVQGTLRVRLVGRG